MTAEIVGVLLTVGIIVCIVAIVWAAAMGLKRSEHALQLKDVLDAEIDELVGPLHDCANCEYMRHAQRDPKRAQTICPICGLQLIKQEERDGTGREQGHPGRQPGQ